MKLEIENKFKLFKRILVSYNDYKQAADIASIILSERYYEKYHNPKKKFRDSTLFKYRVLGEGLNLAMIIAFCRPFSGNDKKSSTKIPDLPKRFIKKLSRKDQETYKNMLLERNKILAHSDSDAWRMEPTYLSFEGLSRKILLPKHSNVRSPLLPGEVQKVLKISVQMMDELIIEREKLVAELQAYIPVQTISKSKISAMAKKMGVKLNN